MKRDIFLTLILLVLVSLSTDIHAAVNLAHGKPAVQSSTGYGGDPGRAVDGNTDGNYHQDSVSHTKADHNAWWEVDIGSVHTIDRVVIWNRTDCCAERLSNMYLMISDKPFQNHKNDLNRINSSTEIFKHYHKGSMETTTTINVKRSGRYVRIQLKGTNYLSLAEVQVLSENRTKSLISKADTLGMGESVVQSNTFISNPGFVNQAWTGTWNTTYKKMELHQTGSYESGYNKVSGSYGNDNGRVVGVIRGNVFEGNWYEDGNQQGKFKFVMALDGKSFSGQWGSGSAVMNSKWDGTRLKFAESGANLQSGKVLFDGSLGKQWLELSTSGGNFEKFAQIENKILLVDVPEGNSWGKTGIRSSKPLIKVPGKEDNFVTKLTFLIDPPRTSDFVFALIPPNWDGIKEWRSHHIRVGLFRGEDKNTSVLTLWIKGKEFMKVNLKSQSIEQISLVLRPDRLVLVKDGKDNTLLQGYLPSKHFSIPEEGYRISVLSHAPKKDMGAKLALRAISKKTQPYEPAKPKDDPTVWLDNTQKTILFDGRILDKHWIKYQAHGGDFMKYAQLKDGALVIDAPEKSSWAKTGLYSPEPLVWLDKFGKNALVRVNFNFDVDQTTGFAVALTTFHGLNGNDPSNPRVLLHWRKTKAGKGVKATLFLSPNKQWKPIWELDVPAKMPEKISFILSPGGIQIDAPGISKNVIPWVVVKPSQSFRIYAYSHPDKNNEPVKMALRQISLERKAGEPVLPPKPGKGIAPLPTTVLFEGKLNEWWEGAGVGGAKFAKYGKFDNGRLIVDVPEKISSWARAGLLSKKPVLVLDERILSTSHKLRIKIDHKQTTGLQIMFHSGKHVEMWGQSTRASIKIMRYTKGLDAGKYKFTLRHGRAPYGVWSRTIDADWVEKNWNGEFTIETGNGWMAMHLANGPSIRGNDFNIHKNNKLYMTVSSRNKESYGPAKMVLERIISEWVMPDGMSKMDRWYYVDNEDFDADLFLDDLAVEINAIDHIDDTEDELDILP